MNFAIKIQNEAAITIIVVNLLTEMRGNIVVKESFMSVQEI